MATGTKPGSKTTSATDLFFDDLSQRGREPLLRRVSGTIRFDLGSGKDAEHRYVTVKKGKVSVSRKKGPADAVVQADESLFEDVAAGKANAMAAVLRGIMVVEGDLGLMMTFQRLFPGPSRRKPRAKSARDAAGKKR
jgi:putative sterol carrier protein